MDTLQAKMFVSSLNNSAAKILVAFILARTALDVQELREWTALKRETIYDGLKTLQSRGMIEKQILEHGRMVWLPSGDFLPGVFQMSEKRTPEIQESRFRTSAPELIVGGDSVNLINLNTPTTHQQQVSEKRTPEPEPEIETLPSILKILRCTDLLFDGSFVNAKGLESRDSEEALAWCAYAYQQFQKQRLDRPAGYVRRQLLDSERASDSMRTGWQSILPESFLRALGLWMEESEPEAESTEPDLADVVVTPDESVNERLDDGKTMSPAQAWQSVLGQLQTEMPRASFETQVRDTQAVCYDRNVLTVGVANAYTREWLENRLTSTVQRLLVGILNRDVEVVFVVTKTEVPA